MAKLSVIGKSVPKVDALEKVTGKAKFGLDIKLPGMLFGKVLRSPYPHARIININTSKVEGLPGVRAVLTGKDAPEAKIGHIQDRPVLAQGIVRFVGEAVVAIAADSVEVAEEASGLIEVNYEELPAIFDPEEAMKPNPPVVIHPDLLQYNRGPIGFPLYRFEPELPNVFTNLPIRKGNVEKGFEESDLIIENRYSVARMQHCPLECHNAVAQPESNGNITVWLSTNSLFNYKREFCRIFKLAPSKVRVIAPYVGGAFGGKESPAVVVPDIAVLLALKTGRPVKLALTRDEVFVGGGGKAQMIIYIKDGVKADGTLVAREMKSILNGGAYSGMSVIIVRMCRMEAIGSYRVPNFKLDSLSVATNLPPVGPFRSFGGAEMVFAIDSQMEIIAEKLGMDPIELRKKNLLKEGEENAVGQITHSIGARECLDKAADWIEWGKPPVKEKGPWKRGKGIAMGCQLSGAGGMSVGTVKIHEDATIEVRHSGIEEGTGVNTVMAQIAAEEFNTGIDKVKIVFTDSAVTPYDHGTYSSRTIMLLGYAVQLACQDAKKQTINLVSTRLIVPPEDLEIKDGVVYARGTDLSLKISELFSPSGFLLSGGEIIGSAKYTIPTTKEDIDTGQGANVAAFSHGADAVEVRVNVETGEIKVIRIGGALDMGQPMNLKLSEGQIEGGLGMGIGMALFEEVVFDNGSVVNPSLMAYRAPRATDVPSGEAMKSMIAAVPHRQGPYGAKGLGEITITPVASAISNAVFNATGVRVKDLPITRERMLKALKTI
ncbi:xanthine dehydrogenase family protein molybdopterin-binding subunit [Chloroflexota bacterium]